MSDDFGLRLREELRKRGASTRLLGIRRRSKIRQLEAADRDQVVGMLKGCTQHTLEHAQRDTPEQLAQYVIAV